MSTESDREKFARLAVESPQAAISLAIAGAAVAFETIEREKMAAEQKREDLRVELYEKRTMMLERLSMAMEHYNEQKFHTV